MGGELSVSEPDEHAYSDEEEEEDWCCLSRDFLYKRAFLLILAISAAGVIISLHDRKKINLY